METEQKYILLDDENLKIFARIQELLDRANFILSDSKSELNLSEGKIWATQTA